ncbi:winged helix DNA-binding domain-containing protein [Paucibacter sp. B2R-40]|uniref:DNA glycosylase AlkZ-like family protein n=1 Tax=Paucibacter sp. B2R-40 TaxID=2893554 RepID=UPI0021E42CFE|nr:crosslink repair DNA glycosylase YcaQ family protein [Paucibacter sp. B2R-40]MCV2357055.1 winged helix DNA-binding domain-containing protein [Paucibacter sp. B2R-40]
MNSAAAPNLEDLRRYAVARSLFTPTTLPAAIKRLGFVQADPIRAPARAQDLTLRLRVKDYRAGDLERRYCKLAIEEDCLVNYGFLPREHLKLMHPRVARRAWDAKTQAHAQTLHGFVSAHGPSHPRDIQAHLDLGSTRNAWGGSSSATTHLLDGMHYRGLLRVQRREAGQRIYAAVTHHEDERNPQAKADALLQLVLAKYAPLPSRSLGSLCSLLGYGSPHLGAEIKRSLNQARQTLPSAEIDGIRWFWLEGENPASKRWRLDDELRLLAPFDPIVWDRLRFELFWGWAYRFEAYTPAAKRKLGYYALPMLWRGKVLGWANLSVENSELRAQFGFVEASAPQDGELLSALRSELARMSSFLGLPPG